LRTLPRLSSPVDETGTGSLWAADSFGATPRCAGLAIRIPDRCPYDRTGSGYRSGQRRGDGAGHPRDVQRSDRPGPEPNVARWSPRGLSMWKL